MSASPGTTTQLPVVVGLDHVDRPLLSVAARTARLHGAPLRVVHAFGVARQANRRHLGSVIADDDRVASQRLLDEARDVLDQEPAPPRVDYALAYGASRDVLEREAARASLLVLGADHVPWVERLLGAEITTDLADAAGCPVMIVPRMALPWRRSGVVVVLESLGDSASPLRLGFEEARARLTPLVVVLVVPAQLRDDDALRVEAQLELTVLDWLATGEPVDVSWSLSRRALEAVVVEESKHAEMVVINRPGRAPSVLLGRGRSRTSTAESQAVGPVVVVPPSYARRA